MQADVPVGAPEGDHRTGARWGNAIGMAAILTVIGLPLEPEGGLDRSWKVGLALANHLDLPFGPDAVFTFGPLGFLAVPLGMYRSQLVLGAAFTVVVAFALYLVVMLWLQTWLEPPIAVLVAVGVMLISGRLPTAELASAALILWVLWLLRREALGHSTPFWALGVLGAATSFLTLVKFSAAVLLVPVALLAVVGPHRLRRLGVALVSAGVAFAVLWLASGQPVRAVGVWVARSVEVAAGYSSAMSGVDTTWTYVLLAIPIIAVVLLGSLRVLREWKTAVAIPFVAVVALGCWLFMKEAFVRFDIHHAPLFLAFAALIVITLPWRARTTALALGALGYCLVVFLANVGGGTPDLVEARVDASSELVRVARETFDDQYHLERRERLASANGFVLDPPILDALQQVGVHTDPGDMGTVYLNDLDWRPVPVFQTYSAYTPGLDAANAKALVSEDGPAGVLHRSHAIDGRNPRWESPDYQLALVCNFEVAAVAPPWQALRRSNDICGEPQLLGTAEVRSDEPIVVPRPTDPSSIVSVRFDLSQSWFDRIATFLLRPPRQRYVEADGERYLFVPGTAAGHHIVRQPAGVGERVLPIGPIDYEVLQFIDSDGPVKASFYEIPIARADQ